MISRKEWDSMSDAQRRAYKEDLAYRKGQCTAKLAQLAKEHTALSGELSVIASWSPPKAAPMPKLVEQMIRVVHRRESTRTGPRIVLRPL